MTDNQRLSVAISVIACTLSQGTVTIAHLRSGPHERLSARRGPTGLAMTAVVQQAILEALARLRQPSEVQLRAPGLLAFPPRSGEHWIHLVPEEPGNLPDLRPLELAGQLLVEVTPLVNAHGGIDHVWAAAWASSRTWLAFSLAKHTDHGEIVVGRQSGSAVGLGLLALTRGLAELPDASTPVRLVTDQDEVAQGTANFGVWQERGWQTSPGRPIAHATYWQQLAEANEKRLVVWDTMLPHHRLRLAEIVGVSMTLDRP